MGVRAKRWQLWLITMFILTGIIGVFQLFEGPKSAGAVTVAGGVVNPTISLPERSVEATALPAWQPPASDSTEARTTSGIQKPVGATTQAPVAHATQVPETQVPATQTSTRSVTVTTQAATSTSAAPTTKAPVISAKAVTTSAAPTSTQPKATTTAPKPATTPATTTAKVTTTAPQPTQSVLKPTASATPTRTATQPRCFRFLIFWICR